MAVRDTGWEQGLPAGVLQGRYGIHERNKKEESIMTNIFGSIFNGTLTLGLFVLALCSSMFLGLLLSLIFMYRNTYTKSFARGITPHSLDYTDFYSVIVTLCLCRATAVQ